MIIAFYVYVVEDIELSALVEYVRAFPATLRQGGSADFGGINARLHEVLTTQLG